MEEKQQCEERKCNFKATGVVICIKLSKSLTKQGIINSFATHTGNCDSDEASDGWDYNLLSFPFLPMFSQGTGST